jgi:hypothetical protein
VFLSVHSINKADPMSQGGNDKAAKPSPIKILPQSVIYKIFQAQLFWGHYPMKQYIFGNKI